MNTTTVSLTNFSFMYSNTKLLTELHKIRHFCSIYWWINRCCFLMFCKEISNLLIFLNQSLQATDMQEFVEKVHRDINYDLQASLFYFLIGAFFSPKKLRYTSKKLIFHDNNMMNHFRLPAQLLSKYIIIVKWYLVTADVDDPF